MLCCCSWGDLFQCNVASVTVGQEITAVTVRETAAVAGVDVGERQYIMLCV